MSYSIWDDPDVQAIADFDGNHWILTDRGLTEPDRPLAFDFVASDRALVGSGTAPLAAYLFALVRGVQAMECFSAEVAVGWRKFITYQTGENAALLWGKHELKEESRIFSEWVVVTINRSGWGPDGNASPLGEQHSWSMALSAETGGGVRRNPATGQFEPPTGDDARAYVGACGLM